MAGKFRRGLVLFLKGFLVLLLCAFALSWISYFWPAPHFKGSPPRRHAVQRNGLDMSEHGAWWGIWAKQFRPTRHEGWTGIPETMLTPSLIGGPIVEHYAGWDVYADYLCLTGEVVNVHISDDDGDFNFDLRLPPGSERFSWRRNHPEDKEFKRSPNGLIVVEIDDDLRKNFPVVYDVLDGDTIKVCGPWVYDRSHDHNEIHIGLLRAGHHHGWMEILEERK